MEVTPVDRAAAFAAALEEICRRNPPSSHLTKAEIRAELKVRDKAVNAARCGAVGTARTLAGICYLPIEEVEAVITLIYG